MPETPDLSLVAASLASNHTVGPRSLVSRYFETLDLLTAEYAARNRAQVETADAAPAEPAAE